MYTEITTEHSSLLHASTAHWLRVTVIGFDAIRERCRALGLHEGCRLRVRGRADDCLLIERECGELVTMDMLAARFVQVIPTGAARPAARGRAARAGAVV